ncbi:Phosphatidylinositol 3-kinase catalytic subunit type 3 [Pseudolycoriella hygida]|uniref:Aminopeptidase N n=1 Tax=Pseudolycoriella hygida TaxID=35572 RepID=A0A9Q0RUI4_9DIPT|nr:Phosphatidylinositol 3-kinase catalytic subunit type 3 [Pseudolycoriella hygida]
MSQMYQVDSAFRYVYSSSLDERVQVKIVTLDGLIHKPSYEKLLEEPLLRFSGLYSEPYPSLMVRLQVYNNDESFGLPVCTSYMPFENQWTWKEWVTLPLQYSDLPRNAMLALTILDCAGAGKTSVIGGTTISLFGKNGRFRQGMFDLRVWPNVEADGNSKTTTPGKGKASGKNNQMQRFGKLYKEYCNGQIPKVEWLDRITFREIAIINDNERRQSEYIFLLIEFQNVIVNDSTYSIIYYEPDGDLKYSLMTKPKLVTVPDSEILQSAVDLVVVTCISIGIVLAVFAIFYGAQGKENLVEKKHHRLARSARSGISDRDAKPTASVRDQLNTIVHRYPPTHQLTSEQQDLLWKYRFTLKINEKALPKFVKCINWETGTEVNQALKLLSQWKPMDVEDALELLGPSFTHPAVRRYATTRLKQAPDEDIILYLLQLVQALKYENFNDIEAAYKRLAPDHEVIKSLDDNENNSTTSESMGSPSESGVANVSQIMHQSHTHSLVSTQTSSIASSNDALYSRNLAGDNNNSTSEISDISNTLMSDQSTTTCDLASFLIQRACRNPTLANYLYWYLCIECESQESVRKQDEQVKNMYDKVLKTFKRTLMMGNPELKQIKINLEKQQIFIDELVKLVKIVAKESGDRKKKTEKFQQLLSDSKEFRVNFANFETIPFPLDPEICIRGIVPQKVSLFKSALTPSKLTFLTTTNKEYLAIFKYGDDLRQDQLILQMITLMDKLLRRENLDLKLTPYRVLATSSKHGFLQYVDSITVAEVLAVDGSIQNFFRKHHPCKNGPYGISAEIMDTYIRSVAGYCVITYLLGVGDRHLDNLLLTTTGKLFHIDFGYILGRDPKPMPPPMKLSKEMVEAMGGISSEHHQEFRKQCYTAFLHLRRHANVMLNLFSLMVDASVPDIALEPDKAVKKVEENLKLALTDEEAVHYLQGLLELSIRSVMPALLNNAEMDTLTIKMKLRLWILVTTFTIISSSASSPPSKQFQEIEPFQEIIDYRLPTRVVPSNYEITITPYFDPGEKQFTFDGVVRITVRTSQQNVNEIVVHAHDLTIRENMNTLTEAKDPTAIIITNRSRNAITQKYTLTLATAMKVNIDYVLEFYYSGNMNTNMKGFYRSSYIQDGVTVWLGATQMEPTYARRVFPCFDEPHFKATFDLKIVRPKNFSISFTNTKLNSSFDIGAHEVFEEFKTTPRMSTYLLGFVVSDFRIRENTARTFSVIARTEAFTQTEYAQNIGPKILTKLEENFNYKYTNTMEKMEMVALPDFNFNAMENWGLLTYRERALLYDPDATNDVDQQGIAKMIGHEQAHMWFGNLITCEWWKYLWLNEGFARYFEYFGLSSLPETNWNLDLQFNVDSFQTALFDDSKSTTHPMTYDVGSPDEILAMFDSISYDKAASIIRMTEHIIGKDNFKRAVQQYINDNLFGISTPEKLYSAFQRYAGDTISIATFLSTWSTQAGYPLVVVERKGDGKNLLISQRRFVLRDRTHNDSTKWELHLNYALSTNRNFENTRPSFVMSRVQESIQLQLQEEVDWAIFNVQQTGFYRVNYDTETWHNIVATLKNNISHIHVLNRAQIIDDSLNLARGNYVDIKFVLSLLEYLQNEENFLPWKTALRNLDVMSSRFNATDVGVYEKFMLQLLHNVYNRLGFTSKATDSRLDIYLRMLVIQYACKFGHEECRKAAKLEFEHMETSSTYKIAANIRPTVYCTGIAEGSATEWNFLWKQFIQENVATEKMVILRALGCTTDRNLLQQYLAYIATEAIRLQDKKFAFESILSGSQRNVQIVLDYVITNSQLFVDSFGGYSKLAELLSLTTHTFTNQQQINELETFFNTKLTEFGESAPILQKAIDNAKSDLRWAQENLHDAFEHMREVAGSASVAVASFVLTLVAIFIITW